MLTAFVNKLVKIRDDNELKGLLWATWYGFFSLFSCYILRAVRDEISSADRGNLQILWTVVFFAMLFAVPMYSWVASKWCALTLDRRFGTGDVKSYQVVPGRV